MNFYNKFLDAKDKVGKYNKRGVIEKRSLKTEKDFNDSEQYTNSMDLEKNVDNNNKENDLKLLLQDIFKNNFFEVLDKNAKKRSKVVSFLGKKLALFCSGIIIISIIILIGVAGFFVNTPQFLWNRLKQMSISLWDGFVGYFVGMDEATVHEDDIKAVAQYLKDMGYDLVGMGFAESVSINERDVITGELKDEKSAENQILDIEAPYLKAYLVAENRTYMINNYTFNVSDAVASIFKTGSFFKEGVGTWGTGLIQLDKSITDALAMPFKSITIGDLNFGELADGVKIERKNNTIRIRRLNFDWFDTHNDYTYYSLAGWSGRYGKPFELSVTLHVATMAPDLVKEFCMNDDLDAKVNLKLKKSNIKGKVKVDGKTIDELERAGIYDEEKIKELREFENKYASEIKTKIPYISSVTKHWFRNVYFEGSDSIGANASTDKGVDENGDAIEDYNEERGIKTQKVEKLSSADDVYSFGNETGTGSFEYTGNDAPDVGGAKITFEGNFSNGIIQTKDAVRGVTNPTTKALFNEKYYVYNGTVEKAEKIQEARAKGDDSIKEEIKMTKESLGAFSILESSETIDAQYIYRDLKELVIELGYFEREDFEKEDLKTLLWPIPEFRRRGWPDRKYEKQIVEYGTLMLCKESVDKIRQAEKAEREKEIENLTKSAHPAPKDGIETINNGGGEMQSGNPGGSLVKSNFTPETASIVEQHLYDFNKFNFNEKMAEYGGFENYCRNQLGGVFATWTGVDNVADVQTEEELQEIAEYVWGLMTIYGFDYCNATPSHYGTWRHADKLSPDDSFHLDTNSIYTGLPATNIDKVCNGSQGVDLVVTNCNWGADYLMYKCGIFSGEDSSKPKSSCDFESLVNVYNCEIITSKEDLKVGDLIECFESPITDYSNPSEWRSHGWFHVCTVGEVDEIEDTITFYDAGHFFTESGNYKHVIKRSGNYFPYAGWVGIRVRNLSEGLIGFPPDLDVIAMAKGKIIAKYEDGENLFSEGYLSELVYGENLAKEEKWEFEPSEQTDEGVRIKITEGPIKGFELVIYGFDVNDDVAVGMEVEPETVIGKTIKSNMCFILIDRDRAVLENVEDYVKPPKSGPRKATVGAGISLTTSPEYVGDDHYRIVINGNVYEIDGQNESAIGQERLRDGRTFSVGGCGPVALTTALRVFGYKGSAIEVNQAGSDVSATSHGVAVRKLVAQGKVDQDVKVKVHEKGSLPGDAESFYQEVKEALLKGHIVVMDMREADKSTGNYGDVYDNGGENAHWVPLIAYDIMNDQAFVANTCGKRQWFSLKRMLYSTFEAVSGKVFSNESGWVGTWVEIYASEEK